MWATGNDLGEVVACPGTVLYFGLGIGYGGDGPVFGAPDEGLAVGLEEHGVELVAGGLNDAPDGHDAGGGEGSELVRGAFVDIDEGVFSANGMLVIEHDFEFAIKDIERLLHIGMDMGGGDFACTELGDCYLGKGAAGLVGGKQDALASHSVGGGDGLYVFELADHGISIMRYF